MKKHLLFLPFFFFLSLSGNAWQATSANDSSDYQSIFELGEITVTGSPDRTVNSSLSYQTIEKFNKTDLSNTLNILPGVNIANVGPRNESVVYVRGFDLRQVPVYIDGVPVYVPYDGYVDMGRFTSFDLAKVNVSKGFTSILYGSNTMGGAINLITRKPVKAFEINGRAGVFSGDGFRWNINAGSRLARFYYQVGISQLKQDTYPLSRDFQPRQYQQTGSRENAYRNDSKISVKAGFTPNETDEYVIGYINQKGEKGTPPYVGNDAAVATRFWQWPEWNKQSLYFISNTAVGKKNHIKTRLYYDTFVNSLFSYDDTTYTTQTRGYAFQSFYDDYTLGGNVEFETRTFTNNILKINAQYKRDIHRENDLNEPVQTFVDNTLSVGVENIYQITPKLSVIPGIAFNIRNNETAQEYLADQQQLADYAASKNNALNAQIGLFWDINARHSLKTSLARKTRFATIKDRYSYRMGQAIPNPDLNAEVALNFDLSYTGRLTDNLSLEASVFNSGISDIIQRVDNVEPNKFQLQNAGKARFYGAEAGLNYKITQGLLLGSNYTYLKRENKTNPDILFTDVPSGKFFAYVDYTFLKSASLLLSFEHNSKRYSTSYGTEVGAYSLVNTRASVQVYKFISVEGGVNNIFDKNYSLVEGFPEAGRNFFINLVFNY